MRMPSQTEIGTAHISYLDKEKRDINQLIIERNKLQKRYKLENSPKLKEKLLVLKRDIAIKTAIWRRKDHFGVMASGELRTRLYQSGYGAVSEKEERLRLIKNEWNRMLDENFILQPCVCTSEVWVIHQKIFYFR